LVGEEIFQHLWNPKVYYCVYEGSERQPLEVILSQSNPFHVAVSDFGMNRYRPYFAFRLR